MTIKLSAGLAGLRRACVGHGYNARTASFCPTPVLRWEENSLQGNCCPVLARDHRVLRAEHTFDDSYTARFKLLGVDPQLQLDVLADAAHHVEGSLGDFLLNADDPSTGSSSSSSKADVKATLLCQVIVKKEQLNPEYSRKDSGSNSLRRVINLDLAALEREGTTHFVSAILYGVTVAASLSWSCSQRLSDGGGSDLRSTNIRDEEAEAMKARLHARLMELEESLSVAPPSPDESGNSILRLWRDSTKEEGFRVRIFSDLTNTTSGNNILSDQDEQEGFDKLETLLQSAWTIRWHNLDLDTDLGAQVQPVAVFLSPVRSLVHARREWSSGGKPLAAVVVQREMGEELWRAIRDVRSKRGRHEVLDEIADKFGRDARAFVDRMSAFIREKETLAKDLKRLGIELICRVNEEDEQEVTMEIVSKHKQDAVHILVHRPAAAGSCQNLQDRSWDSNLDLLKRLAKRSNCSSSAGKEKEAEGEEGQEEGEGEAEEGEGEEAEEAEEGGESSGSLISCIEERTLGHSSRRRLEMQKGKGDDVSLLSGSSSSRSEMGRHLFFYVVQVGSTAATAVYQQQPGERRSSRPTGGCSGLVLESSAADNRRSIGAGGPSSGGRRDASNSGGPPHGAGATGTTGCLLSAEAAGAVIQFFEEGRLIIPDVMAHEERIAELCLVRFHVGKMEKGVAMTNSVGGPNKSAALRIRCPGSVYGRCSSSVRDWHCGRCAGKVEYGYDGYGYCDCGRGRIDSLEYRCRHSLHGEKYLRFRPEDDLSSELDTLKKKEELNILLLGETGVGKSTFINAFANYLTHDTLDDALEDPITLIPSTFTVCRDGEFDECTVKIGKEDQNEGGEGGKSSTQSCKAYKFHYGDRMVRLIDTPGIGDTRGIEQDKKNFDNILHFLGYHTQLHGICILLKPNNARLTVMFRFCILELLSHLHKSAKDNIAFVFTNARSTFYRPGDTMPPLRTMLKKICEAPPYVDIPISKSTIFCLDNESFRFMAALKQGLEFEKDQRADFSQSWTVSVNECRRLMDYVATRAPHKVQDTVSVNEARRLILRLSKPLGDTTRNIQLNLKIMNEKMKDIDFSAKHISDLKKQLMVPAVDLEYVALTQPHTVCTSPRCRDTVVSCNQTKYDYKTRCHRPCYLENVEVNIVNNTDLKNCGAMDPTGTCRHCGCNWDAHMHVLTETRHVTINIQDKGVAEQIKTKEQAKEALLRTVEIMKRRAAQLQEEERVISKTSAKFARFLKCNAITAYNDALLDYLNHLIEEERNLKLEGANNAEILNGLVRMRDTYECEMKIINETGADADSSSASPASSGLAASSASPEDIQQMVQNLFQLEINGKMIKQMMEEMNRAVQASHFTYSETTVRTPKRFPFFSSAATSTQQQRGGTTKYSFGQSGRIHGQQQQQQQQQQYHHYQGLLRGQQLEVAPAIAHGLLSDLDFRQAQLMNRHDPAQARRGGPPGRVSASEFGFPPSSSHDAHLYDHHLLAFGDGSRSDNDNGMAICSRNGYAVGGDAAGNGNGYGWSRAAMDAAVRVDGISASLDGIPPSGGLDSLQSFKMTAYDDGRPYPRTGGGGDCREGYPEDGCSGGHEKAPQEKRNGILRSVAKAVVSWLL
ncbi:hypothetical protein CBR_g12333 [Chara braunii]|uniref:DUF8206 domain-containing protein n=1 Tax=Chara braunii TaxID=69332 RepID=A0A388KRS0_CHABU|nr:hypothetical protein CBR_g12333 [Chara braunii]|eukprot:GBG72765.1 hypothetical protein CBR_g12333 [Chara braunii]